MDIEGLGGETVALLFNNGLVHNYADLYELTVNQILPWEQNSQNQYTYFRKCIVCIRHSIRGERWLKKLPSIIKILTP
jgi:NAD-dependent DNA ligase